jgi:hypothetical protein
MTRLTSQVEHVEQYYDVNTSAFARFGQGMGTGTIRRADNAGCMIFAKVGLRARSSRPRTPTQPRRAPGLCPATIAT